MASPSMFPTMSTRSTKSEAICAHSHRCVRRSGATIVELNAMVGLMIVGVMADKAELAFGGHVTVRENQGAT